VGANIVTADAFSNRQWVVVDTFRFTDTFRTLEMNASEHEAFVKSVHDVMTGEVSLEKLLSGRRRGRRKAPLLEVATRVEFDDEASSHSTLLEVVTQPVFRVLGERFLREAAPGLISSGAGGFKGRRRSTCYLAHNGEAGQGRGAGAAASSDLKRQRNDQGVLKRRRVVSGQLD
jgi:[protein-PII] uridylyltransferase